MGPREAGTAPSARHLAWESAPTGQPGPALLLWRKPSPRTEGGGSEQPGQESGPGEEGTPRPGAGTRTRTLRRISHAGFLCDRMKEASHGQGRLAEATPSHVSRQSKEPNRLCHLRAVRPSLSAPAPLCADRRELPARALPPPALQRIPKPTPHQG